MRRESTLGSWTIEWYRPLSTMMNDGFMVSAMPRGNMCVSYLVPKTCDIFFALCIWESSWEILRVQRTARQSDGLFRMSLSVDNRKCPQRSLRKFDQIMCPRFASHLVRNIWKITGCLLGHDTWKMSHDALHAHLFLITYPWCGRNDVIIRPRVDDAQNDKTILLWLKIIYPRV